MNTKTFSASCMKEDARVALGRQMENNYRAITFDLSGFGVEVVRAMIVHQRKLDSAPYVVTSVTGQDSITWTVTNTDTAYAGSGRAEIRIEFADGLAKTVVFQTVVIASITADTEIPEPLQSWYDAMIDYIDDHSVSPEQIEQAVADYLDEHPVQAPVTSVNSKIGAVVLNADDVGALPDTTTAADLGAYVKPSGGIPKTDLSTAVQASLNKADTALQSAPVTSVNTKTGAVVLTASDVGAYTKPSGGIPKSDLTASVQTSLNKADTALQSAPVTSVNSKTGAVTLNASDVGAMPSSYVAPVTSVDGKTGAVQIMPSGGSVGQVLTKTSSGTAWQTPQAGGAVDSVNGQTGVVVLDAEDVGALPDDTTYVSTFNGQSGAVTYTAPVTSVNGQTGAVTGLQPTLTAGTGITITNNVISSTATGSVQTVNSQQPDGNGNVVTQRELTQAQYDALTPAEKNNGVLYMITDSAPSTDYYTKTETDGLLAEKIDEPSVAGTNGQVLTSDGAGGATWETPSGGGGSNDWTLLVDTTLEADQTSNIIYDWTPGYNEIHYSICAAAAAGTSIDLIVYTADSTSNQPRFGLSMRTNGWELNYGQLSANPLQHLRNHASVGGVTDNAPTNNIAVQFVQQNRTGKITRFWLLYGASTYLPAGSTIKIWGR